MDVHGQEIQRTQTTIQYGDIELDTRTGVAHCGGACVRLTGKECALLAALLRAPGRVQSRAALLAAVWQAQGDMRTRTVDMHIRNLRKKLGAYHRIVTIHRGGYFWQAEDAEKKEGP